jgi:nicotinamide-nucleotide amidase
MKALMTEQVLPILQKKFTLPHIQHTTLMTYGMGESSLSKKIESWENNLPSHIRLAYLPSPGVVKLRLSGKGFDKEKLANDMAAEVRGLEKIIPELIVGFDREETIQVVVSKLFKEAQATLSLAESCTGGFIAQLFTAIPGASNFFKGAVVAYTEAVKKQELGVSQNTLDQNTVVSKEVAVEMALGAQLKFDSDYAIATTGNAGPSADHTNKPVGVICIAIATPKGVFAEEFNFGSPREKVIQRCANKALELLRKEIIKNYAK